jgi:enediyne biosynthesis protein E4
MRIIFGFIMLFILSGCNQKSETAEKENKAPQYKLFTLKTPDETGIRFTNTITDKEEVNRLTYEYYYNGGGVAVGDINNDGLDDLYFTGNMVEDKLYLNKGNLQFEDITAKSGIDGLSGWHTGVVMTDINQDGLTDIYVCRSGWFENPDERRNLLYINNGDLTFSEQAARFGLNDPSHSVQAAFFDYDRDGDLDMYLATHALQHDNFNDDAGRNALLKNAGIYGDRLFRNDNGHFTNVTAEAGIQALGFGHGIAIGDLNGDDWPDILVSRDFDDPDLMYINHGDGTFSDQIKSMTNHTSYFSMGNDISDFNNDGLPDFIVLDMTPDDHYRAKTNMASMNPEQFKKLASIGFHKQYMVNTLQLNNGNGFYSDIAQMSGVSKTDWSWSALFADLDNDGFKDLYITNGVKKDVLNNDNTTRGREKIQSLGRMLSFLEILDIMPANTIQNRVYQNDGHLKFIDNRPDWGLDQKVNSNGCVIADLDNDGDLDIVVNNVDRTAYLYENQTAGYKPFHFLDIVLKGPANNLDAIGATVTIEHGSQLQTLTCYPTRGYLSSAGKRLHFGLGENPDIDRLTVKWPDGMVTVLENVKPDQLLELDYNTLDKYPGTPENKIKPLFAKDELSGIQFRHKESDYNDFEKEILLPHKYSQNGPFASVADVNNDGLEDVFIGGAAGQAGTLFLQDENGHFNKKNTPAFDSDKAYEDMGSLFFDADGDGDPDLYVVSGSNEFPENSKMYRDRLYFNDGNGNFKRNKAALPQITGSGQVVISADFDMDGDSDLFVGGRIVPGKYPFAPKSYLLENNGGIFNDITASIAPGLEFAGLVTDAVFTDMDADNDPDLIITGEWMPITVFENHNGRFVNITDKAGLENSNGWWYSIRMGDFDKDGDMDFIAGNLGLNAKFKASQEIPFHVFCHDFDQNGTLDIVLGNQKGNHLLPVRGKECSSEQMPFIKEKFPTYDAFAEADLASIYGAENLAQALHLEAKMFESVYAENTGNGQFKLHPLPLEAQFSQVQAIQFFDFNTDGNLDVLLAGNQFETEVETVPYDASIGCLLLGDGKGNFKPLPWPQSGAFMPGNVKDVQWIKTKNGYKLLVMNNDGVVEVFERY